MRCSECGGEFRDVHGELRWQDRYAGALVVSGIAYRRCDGCAEVLLPPGAVGAIEAARRKKLDEWLENRPLKDFWDSKQVTEFLGITRQALSKGVQLYSLVYRTWRHGKYFYLADSVQQYKRTGDGRIRLEFADETTVLSMPDRVMSECSNTDPTVLWVTAPPATKPYLSAAGAETHRLSAGRGRLQFAFGGAGQPGGVQVVAHLGTATTPTDASTFHSAQIEEEASYA